MSDTETVLPSQLDPIVPSQLSEGDFQPIPTASSTENLNWSYKFS